MSYPSDLETRLSKCPDCLREIPDSETPIRCSHTGCIATNYSCCDDFERCEECHAPVCGFHCFAYSHYVLCFACHVADSKRRMAFGSTVMEMITESLAPKQYTEQDGRSWTGYVGCEDILQRIAEDIASGTIAPEVTP